MSKLIVIDRGTQHVRILEGDTRGSRVVVRKFTTLAVPEGHEGESETVRSLMVRALESAAGSGAKLVGLIGRSQAVLRDLRLPDAPAEEMPAMVQMQAMRELSFPVEQAAIDFEVVGPPDSEGQRRIILAALQLDVIERVRQAFSPTQLELSRIGLRPYATWRAYRQVAVVPAGAVLVVSLAGESLELTVAQGETVLFSRATLLRGAVDSKAESFDPAPALLGEVRRTLAAFTNQMPGTTVERVALAAGRDEHKQLSESLAAGLSIPVDRFDPFEAIDLGRDVSHAAGDRGAFVAAIGAAIAINEPWPIDFLNPKKPVVRRDRRKPLALVAAAAAALVIAASYVTVQLQLARGRRNIEGLAKQQAALQNMLKDANEVLNKYHEVETWTKAETKPLEELRRLSEEFPDTRNMYTTALTINRDNSPGRSGKIVLDGQAKQQVAISEFRTRLNRGDIYRAQPVATASTASQDKTKGSFPVPFRTVIEVRSADADEAPKQTSSGPASKASVAGNKKSTATRDASVLQKPSRKSEPPTKSTGKKSK